MKKLSLSIFIITVLLTSCGGSSNKKRNLDATLFKYASLIRWSNFDAAINYLKPEDEDIKPSGFELERLKQFKVSQYLESPITPGSEEHIILQSVEIQLYNIHTNKTKTIYDHQSWEYDDKLKQWFLTTGIPKL
ncbi:MAG: hypothetical protein JKY19_03470 [Alcanivoracaceae bacterium]|nr:hypothetical protein [Alcanivoracaceae bacterium]